MQSKKTKNKAKETVKKITSFLNAQYKDHSRLYKILFILGVVVLVFVGSFACYFFAGKPHLGKIKETRIVKNTKDKLLDMADEEYENGYLENSAVYYKSYINANPSNKNKIIAYQRLFEISVLQKQYYMALDYLKEIESLDSSIQTTYISRLRLLLRIDAFNDARREIDLHYPRLKKSNEYKELVSVYFMKLGKYNEGLSELLKIPFDKREIDVHKRIIYNYIQLDQITNAQAYIGKIDSKIRTFGFRDFISEFSLIKAIVAIFQKDLSKAKQELSFCVNSNTNNYLALRLLTYVYLLDDSEDMIISAKDKNIGSIAQDSDFVKNIADYFYFKKNYSHALEYYELLNEITILKKDETMALADLYYKNESFDKSILMIKKLGNEYAYKGESYYKNLAVNYLKLHNEQQALFYLREALDYYPSDIDNYVRLANYYVSIGDGETVMKLIEEAKQACGNSFDKRLDVLKVKALSLLDVEMTEVELLALRERGLTNAEYYFKLIEHYIANNQYNDAKREFDTVSVLDLDTTQQQTLLVYKLFFALQLNDEIGVSTYISQILDIIPTNTISVFNQIICNMLNYNFDEAINVLNTLDKKALNTEFKSKAYYLLAVCYYMKHDNNSAYKNAKLALAIKPSYNKANFLMTLVTE